MEHTLNDVQQSQPEDRINKKQETTTIEPIDNNKEDTTNSTTTPLTVTFIQNEM